MAFQSEPQKIEFALVRAGPKGRVAGRIIKTEILFELQDLSDRRFNRAITPLADIGADVAAVPRHLPHIHNRKIIEIEEGQDRFRGVGPQMLVIDGIELPGAHDLDEI